ncbi:MAG: segregation/condensation protein A [Mycoplasmataceae bacterium]|nr:segregation/condensation protein A [Mycoplasmataceae bacterium]
METTDINDWKVQIQDYYGPLDALLNIIKKNHMAILKLELSVITEQYVNYVNDLLKNALTQREIDKFSDYLYLAQYLINLKSKYLIHQQNQLNEIEEELDWSQEDLTKLLLEVEKYKNAMIELYEKQTERILMISKPNSKFESFIPADFNYEKLPNKMNPDIFLKYLDDFEELHEIIENSEQDYEIIDISTLEIEEKIMQYLKIHHEAQLLVMLKDFYKENKYNLYYLVSIFIAALNLASEFKITLNETENKLFLILND